MSELVLHYAPDNASLCVRLVLDRLETPYRTVFVDRRMHEQESAEFRAINPNGKIPAIETPDGPMFETAAIMLWLADQNAGTLFPAAGAPERISGLSWLFWLSNTFHPCLRRIFYADTYGEAKSVRTAAKTEVLKLAEMLDAKWPSIECPLLSCYAAPLLRWVVLYGGSPGWFEIASFPNLHKFVLHFEAESFVQQAIEAEGLGPTPFSAPMPPSPPEGHVF